MLLRRHREKDNEEIKEVKVEIKETKKEVKKTTKKKKEGE